MRPVYEAVDERRLEVAHFLGQMAYILMWFLPGIAGFLIAHFFFARPMARRRELEAEHEEHLSLLARQMTRRSGVYSAIEDAEECDGRYEYADSALKDFYDLGWSEAELGRKRGKIKQDGTVGLHYQKAYNQGFDDCLEYIEMTESMLRMARKRYA